MTRTLDRKAVHESFARIFAGAMSLIIGVAVEQWYIVLDLQALGFAASVGLIALGLNQLIEGCILYAKST